MPFKGIDMFRAISEVCTSVQAAFIMLLMSSSIVVALVPEEQRLRMETDLTPLGSERGANADGTIPPWTGGLTSIPEGIGYEKGKHLPDPFSNDKILFTVNSENVDQYDAYITRGQRALIERHENYFMNVYPTHRSCGQPEYVYEAARKNAAVGELVAEGNGVAKAIMASPFPIPNNALEIVWNHTLRYRDYKVQSQAFAVPVNQNGDFYIITTLQDAILRWSNPQFSAAEELNNISILFLLQVKAPPRRAGYVVLVQESLNMAIEGRRAWTYSPGTRRVRRAPTIAYDNPGTNSDGITTADSFGGFNGAPDRFNWTVLGRSEKIISYNNFRKATIPHEELVTHKHLDQSKLRYERHRVWEVQGTKKENFRHIYAKRIFYIDEDTKQIMATEIYDGRQQLWRVQELDATPRYDVPVCWSNGATIYDLIVGRYLLGTGNPKIPVNFDADHLEPQRYTPGNIRRLGR